MSVNPYNLANRLSPSEQRKRRELFDRLWAEHQRERKVLLEDQPDTWVIPKFVDEFPIG